jgi:hypothetical protein
VSRVILVFVSYVVDEELPVVEMREGIALSIEPSARGVGGSHEDGAEILDRRVYWVFALLGCGVLVFWNAVVGSVDYFR